MEELKVCGLNMDIAWKNPLQNFQLVEREFKDAAADLFLLPEMFPTGFCMEAQEIADRSGETLSWMKNFAAAKNAAVAGSVSVEENGRFYNRFYFVKPDGSYDFYDKRHLFSYSGEDNIYTPGKERKTVEYKGFKILLQVCYDLRFPVFSRNSDEYDVALYVANWPQTRVEAWRHLLKARAIENLCYVFGLNRTGTDGNGLLYEESSMVFAPDGKEISDKNGNLVSAVFNKEDLQKFRERFQFLNDADRFNIKF